MIGRVAILVSALSVSFGSATRASDLPSWNDGSAKSAIVEFVPESERIAVLDNDGLLQPIHIHGVIGSDRLRISAQQHRHL